jgi:3,4-dihydroxy 2-butanone 4-phosphate synthase/GTP cyclohydrolase II
VADTAKTPFCTLEEAVEEIRNGRMIVLVDDEDRENEGDLTMAADEITPEAINFMANYGRGLICLTLTEQRCDEIHLPLMSPINTSVHGTAFCEAIDRTRARPAGSLTRPPAPGTARKRHRRANSY